MLFFAFVAALCALASPCSAENVDVWLTNEQLGASEHDSDILWCRDKHLWHWQVRSLLPWDAAPDDLYRWKNQHADIYVDMSEYNMMQWLSGISSETYNHMFDFMRIRILYARQQARKGQLRRLLRLKDRQRVVPVHQHLALNYMYGSVQVYTHVPNNVEIEHLAQMDNTYTAFMRLLKLVLASVLFWSNMYVVYSARRKCFEACASTPMHI